MINSNSTGYSEPKAPESLEDKIKRIKSELEEIKPGNNRNLIYGKTQLERMKYLNYIKRCSRRIMSFSYMDVLRRIDLLVPDSVFCLEKESEWICNRLKKLRRNYNQYMSDDTENDSANNQANDTTNNKTVSIDDLTVRDAVFYIDFYLYNINGDGDEIKKDSSMENLDKENLDKENLDKLINESGKMNVSNQRDYIYTGRIAKYLDIALTKRLLYITSVLPVLAKTGEYSKYKCIAPEKALRYYAYSITISTNRGLYLLKRTSRATSTQSKVEVLESANNENSDSNNTLVISIEKAYKKEASENVSEINITNPISKKSDEE